MARPSLPVGVSKRFWEGVREGLCVDDASAGAGVSQATGWRWFGSRGGVLPSCSSTAEPSGLRLSFAEREEIACLAAAGHSARSIARELGRAPSTITRELSLRRSPDGRYRASTAQAAADASARRPKLAKLAINARLRVEVQARLELHHSPEPVTGADHATVAGGLPRRSGVVGVARDHLPVAVRAGPRGTAR